MLSLISVSFLSLHQHHVCLNFVCFQEELELPSFNPNHILFVLQLTPTVFVPDRAWWVAYYIVGAFKLQALIDLSRDAVRSVLWSQILGL
jgi:hypothetical protein